MLQKLGPFNFVYSGPAPEGTLALERDGHHVLRGELSPSEVGRLKEEVLAIYARVPPEMRDSASTPEIGAMYRYQMFNHGPLCQEALARPGVLAVVEPLLGDDCHVIACTCWRNPPGRALTPNGLEWHVDGGPHVPLPEGARWPEHLPFPVFAVTAHLHLEDVRLEDGPTACIPGSHRSGQVPPYQHTLDPDLTWGGRGAVAHLVRAGDVDLRVSDVWHRRLPPAETSAGRFFLQITYARREIAQRVLPTSEVNHTTAESRARARSERERCLIGLHPQGFYDA